MTTAPIPPSRPDAERPVEKPLEKLLNDRPVVLITGASSGVGHAAARRFAARGWRVFASMRRPERSEALRAEADARRWTLQTPQLDVTDDLSVTRAIGAMLQETRGRIDLLVNNAAYYAFGALEETTPDELRAQMETNLIGVHRVTRAVLPAMRERRAGRILVVGSVSGLVVLPAVGPYHTSKWAIEAWTETLRYEVSAWGIGVVLIEPGPFKTALHENEVKARAAQAADSPYAGLLAAYERQAKSLRRAELPALINIIERAATARCPPLRWPVGPNAFSAAYLRRFVPDRVYELVVRFVFRSRSR
jgi:NAD(P)-dependent dehydrogenase (short-subunit alcohol dehydrogenase family)